MENRLFNTPISASLLLIEAAINLARFFREDRLSLLATLRSASISCGVNGVASILFVFENRERRGV